MQTSRMTTKGQVTVPKEMRDRFGWKPGDELRFVQEADGVKIVEAGRQRRGAQMIRRLRRVRWKPGLTTDQVMAMTRGEPE